jgi:cytochrome c biogenesis protein CcmG, thiol:disulfide interchange protein DsbE
MSGRARRPTLSGRAIAVGVGAVVALLTVVAIVATRGGSVPSSQEARPVEVVGELLPKLGDPGAADPAAGLVAPTLKGQGFDGAPVGVTPGRPTLVVFLAHWCPHCQREVPALTKWAAAGGVPEGVDVIGVATATTPDRPNYPPSKWLREEQFPFPVLADDSGGSAAAAFGLTGYPFFTLLDADGRVLSRASGEVEVERLSELLNAVA